MWSNITLECFSGIVGRPRVSLLLLIHFLHKSSVNHCFDTGLFLLCYLFDGKTIFYLRRSCTEEVSDKRHKATCQNNIAVFHVTIITNLSIVN